MKISIIFTILFLSTAFYHAQVVVSGKVVDKNNTSILIQDVNVFVSVNKLIEVKSDINGEFKLKLTSLDDEDTIFFEHVGFESTFKTITSSEKKKAKNQSIKLQIEMDYTVLNTFVVNAKKVDTVYGSTRHSVEDFLILNDNQLLLLAYERTLKKGAKIVLTDANQKDISEATIPGNATHLFKDYSGIPYVICENKIFAIEIIKEQIRFESVDPQEFYDFHHRVIDTLGSNFYYSTFNELYPAVTFIVTDRNDTTHHELLEIKDDFMMELYRAQFKYVSGRDKLWAYRQELATGIDKEIWIGASSFTQDILYKPVYAPLFIIRDTVHLFDQYKKQLFKFDSDHQLVDSIYLDFVQDNQKEKWEQPLVLDKQQDKVYGLYNKGGYYYIKSINCQDGKVNRELKLSNRFVERIKVYDGKVFYIYRPYESLQKKFIYSEDLN